MKARVIGSTHVGYSLPLEDAMLFSGHSAGICYMPDDIDTLFAEPTEKTEKRAQSTLISGHHSVFGHVYYNFIFEGIPKILAMVLNNEKLYNTSEKSARYTKMEPSKEEKELYEKWTIKYFSKIQELYPEIKEKQANKLALENARYLISVFTPATTMEYTVDLRQMRYILQWMEKFCNTANDTLFNIKLKNVFKEFISEMLKCGFNKLDDEKNRNLSLFATRTRSQEWGENYSTNYQATFAELAQAQRHRTLNYEISIPEKTTFYVPKIIRGTELEGEWIDDIESLVSFFPQGILIDINERGTVENFILKSKERLCGRAQIEVAEQTELTLKQYLKEVKDKNPEVYQYLLPYSKGARCTFPDYKCGSPCMWGAQNALNRNI